MSRARVIASAVPTFLAEAHRHYRARGDWTAYVGTALVAPLPEEVQPHLAGHGRRLPAVRGVGQARLHGREARLGAPLGADAELERQAEQVLHPPLAPLAVPGVHHQERLGTELSSHGELPARQRGPLPSPTGLNLDVVHGHAAGHDRLLDLARQDRKRALQDGALIRDPPLIARQVHAALAE